MRTVSIYWSLLWVLFLPLTSCDRGSNQPLGNNDTVPAQETEAGSWDPQQDASFLIEAGQVGRKIVQYNQLAAQKASSATVKNFAEQSATWHQKVNEELRQIAAQQQVALPEEAGENLQKELEELKSLPASEFDLKYLQALRDAQEKMISMCQEAAINARSNELRMWARKAIPKMQAHAQAVQDLSDQLKN